MLNFGRVIIHIFGDNFGDDNPCFGDIQIEKLFSQNWFIPFWNVIFQHKKGDVFFCWYDTEKIPRNMVRSLPCLGCKDSSISSQGGIVPSREPCAVDSPKRWVCNNISSSLSQNHQKIIVKFTVFRKLSGFGGFSTKFGGLECFSLFEKVYFFRFQNGSSEEENLHLWRDDFSLADGDDHETAVVWCALVLVLVLVVDDDDDDDDDDDEWMNDDDDDTSTFSTRLGEFQRWVDRGPTDTARLGSFGAWASWHPKTSGLISGRWLQHLQDGLLTSQKSGVMGCHLKIPEKSRELEDEEMTPLWGFKKALFSGV